MPVEQNIELMQRWFREVWNEGKTQTVYELFSPDGVARGQAGPQAEIHGPAEFVQFAKLIRAAFPDITTTIEDAFGAADKVVVRWSAVMNTAEMAWDFLPRASQSELEESLSLDFCTEKLLRAGTTGTNSRCWSKSALTNSLKL
jgi:SnoaL-like polyketide cyclase